MSGMTFNADVARVRPSRLVAEALVHRHDREQVERRARAMGIPRDMATVVATVCCRCGETASTPGSCDSSGDASSRA